jgi:hypothetical protein
MVVDLVKAEHSVFLWLRGSIQSVFWKGKQIYLLPTGNGGKIKALFGSFFE